MGCSLAVRPAAHGHETSIEVAQSSSTLLQSLAADITQDGKVYSSSNVADLFKKLQVKPILIKYKPSQGVRLNSCSILPSCVILNCVECTSRFDPDIAQPSMLYSKEMQSLLTGTGIGDNSIGCLTAFASSLNRVVSKLQRERILSAILFTEAMEQGTCGIRESLQKQMVFTDIQLQRTLETSSLIQLSGSSDRVKKLMQDGINQFHSVSSKLQIQRKQVATACASLAARSSKSSITVQHPMHSWCARYHLLSAGKTGYDTLIERLISWVALAICSIPSIVDSDGSAHHQITQASCILVMAFKELLTRERTFLVSKGRSLMLKGGNAEKVFAILSNTRSQILNEMRTLVAATPDKAYMMGIQKSELDLVTDGKSVPCSTPEGDKLPPIVDMLHKYEVLQILLRDEERKLLAAAAQSNSPSLIMPSESEPSLMMPSELEPPGVYMAWFQASQIFFDLIELSLSGLMRHFVLSVPTDMACFPVDLERTVPMTTCAHASPQLALGTSKAMGPWTPSLPEKLCDLSEGLVGEIVTGLKQRQYTNIVALVGAGLSVAAGVPDFRSPGGLYDQMRSQGFQNPMQVFTSDFLRQNPDSFYNLFSQLRTDHLCPTMAHCFLRLLSDQGCLLRCYTQNIDALERKVGLPAECLVEAHGTMSEARCLECGAASTPEALWGQWNGGGGQLPRCASSGCQGLLRPAVVFFGEHLDVRFRTNSTADLNAADLVLIIGTSLSVEPFASLVQRTPRTVPRLLVNRHVPYVMQRRPWELLTPSAFTKSRPMRKDASLLGECDDIMLQLMHELGWDNMLAELERSWEHRGDSGLAESVASV